MDIKTTLKHQDIKLLKQHFFLTSSCFPISYTYHFHHNTLHKSSILSLHPHVSQFPTHTISTATHYINPKSSIATINSCHIYNSFTQLNMLLHKNLIVILKFIILQNLTKNSRIRNLRFFAIVHNKLSN